MIKKLWMTGLLLLIITSSARAITPEEIWNNMVARENEPAQFSQTVTTLFPGRSVTTKDYVIRQSLIEWKLTRTSDLHETLFFGSTGSRFFAFAPEFKQGVVIAEPRNLSEMLNPPMPVSPEQLNVIDHQNMRGQHVWLLEKEVSEDSLVRYWIAKTNYQLLKQEALDSRGKVIYTMTRDDFSLLDGQTVLESPEQIPQWQAAQIFDDEKLWWQSVLIARINSQGVQLLLPTYLPAGMYLVAASSNRDGVVSLRYADGRRVFSIFQKKDHAYTREGYIRRKPIPVYNTKRLGFVVTFVGQLSVEEAEQIARSLE